MGGIEVRDSVVEKREAALAAAEQPVDELLRLRWGGVDERRPDIGGILARRDDRPVSDVETPGEHRCRRRILPQRVE